MTSPDSTTAPGTRHGRPQVPQQRPALRTGPAADDPDDQAWLRQLAGRGEIAMAIAAGQGRRLRSAAWALAYPIVFDVITRRLELTRGHNRCARGVLHLSGPCLDGFYDDVDALTDYLLAAAKPIDDLEGWLAHWASKAAVDGHRRRRGATGALQRPRMTRVLSEGLGHDPWLCDLALKILVWVGVPTSAGADLWPLESWARCRAVATGDHAGSTTSRVATEVEKVLEVMRRRPDWYEAHVERPLGHKVAPIAAPPGDGPGDPRPLLGTTPADTQEVQFRDLAAAATDAIRDGLRRHRDPAETVREVVGRLFLGGTAADEIDRVPSAGQGIDQRLSALLGDPAALAGLVDRILRVIRDETSG